MSEDEGFLRRWSRRKRGAELAPVPQTPVPQTPVEPVAIEAEIAAPPPADSIPLEDIGAWLSKRLPDGWREVALRRVWSADVAIRDHIGLADYAWDFTVAGDMPGGVPGWGPLTEADNLADLLSRAINGSAEVPPPPTPDPPPPDPVAPDPVVSDLTTEPPALCAMNDAAPAESPVDGVSDQHVPPPLDRPRRRGGAAMPHFDA